MEMKSGHIDAVYVFGQPVAEDRPFDILELKRRLIIGDLHQAGVRFGLLRHASGFDVFKRAIQSYGVEDVFGRNDSLNVCL